MHHGPEDRRVVPQLRPLARRQHAPDPATLVELLARAVARLSAPTVAVIGDQPGLPEALGARGVTVVAIDDAADHPPALAIVRADAAPADEALAKLGPVRVLAWQSGDVSFGDYVWAAAQAGYFRSTRRMADVRGATCVLLDAGDPNTTELVNRYETILAGGPELDQELRDLRHELLASRDHAIGAEAELAQLRARQSELLDQISAMYATTTWRVGSAVVAPLGKARRALRK
ncbi:MAG: hypothetical protein QOG80_2746 [Pseudonocardiales bacterium]|jgi:hypothetical protein|nr:hypothetical protein [Pseudonocardiales bacterium]